MTTTRIGIIIKTQSEQEAEEKAQKMEEIEERYWYYDEKKGWPVYSLCGNNVEQTMILVLS
jgi:hypothetical protein